MKHRKHGSNNTPNKPETPLDNNQLSTNNRPSTKYNAPAMFSKGSVILITLLLMFVIWVTISSVTRSPSSALSSSWKNGELGQSPQPETKARGSGLRSRSMADLAPPLPYATLQADLGQPSGYGNLPLIGLYSLGEDCQLQNNNADIKGDKIIVSGIVQYPSSDLSTVLTEEAQKFGVLLSTLNKDEGIFMSDLFQSALTATASNNEQLGLNQNDQALLTRCGFKNTPFGKVPNQDRSIIVRFYLKTGGSINNTAPEQHALLMGIFDGHGDRGHETSHYVALEFPRVFASAMKQHSNLLPGAAQYDEQMRNTLTHTFLKLDEKEPVKGAGGCTASTAFYPGIGTKVYLANVGDSTTLIVHYKKSTGVSAVVRQNRKDKPHLDDERKRIESAGGQVYIPPSFLLSGGESKESSRVFIPVADGTQLALAMSRSIGDFDGKAVGLIADPIVDVWDVQEYYNQHQFSKSEIDDSAWFIVIASDGVYDVITPEEVVQHLGRSLYDELPSAQRQVSPLVACEQLIRKASHRWMEMTPGMPYRDDITLGVSRLNFMPS